jgi:peptidoglycan/xylan/chitin deacetylase (PgdA/CDA1 family)
MTGPAGATAPRGAASSMAFTFDLDAEEVWIGENAGAVQRPVTLSQGHYGPRVAVPAILALLTRHDIVATFFIPGRVAETYPRCVEAILEAGHEVAHHGYTHRAPSLLAEAEEREEFERSIAALRTFGVEPVGYRAPSWDLTNRTIGLAAAYGFRYSSNFMSDIRPFMHAATGLMEVPVHWTLDDAAHFWFSGDTWTKAIATNSQVEEIFAAEARGIARLGGCCVYTFHPQIIGRPGRLELLDSMLGEAARRTGVWVTTTANIAEAARSGPAPPPVYRAAGA